MFFHYFCRFLLSFLCFFFFFNDTATTEIYTLSLHDALPILPARNPPKLAVEGGLDRCPLLCVLARQSSRRAFDSGTVLLHARNLCGRPPDTRRSRRRRPGAAQPAAARARHAIVPMSRLAAAEPVQQELLPGQTGPACWQARGCGFSSSPESRLRQASAQQPDRSERAAKRPRVRASRSGAARGYLAPSLRGSGPPRSGGTQASTSAAKTSRQRGHSG